MLITDKPYLYRHGFIFAPFPNYNHIDYSLIVRYKNVLKFDFMSLCGWCQVVLIMIYVFGAIVSSECIACSISFFIVKIVLLRCDLHPVAAALDGYF